MELITVTLRFCFLLPDFNVMPLNALAQNVLFYGCVELGNFVIAKLKREVFWFPLYVHISRETPTNGSWIRSRLTYSNLPRFPPFSLKREEVWDQDFMDGTGTPGMWSLAVALLSSSANHLTSTCLSFSFWKKKRKNCNLFFSQRRRCFVCVCKVLINPYIKNGTEN